MDTLSCFYGQLLAKELLCPDYGDSDFGITGGCIVALQFGEVDNLPQLLRESLPPFYPAPQAKCTQRMIQQTWDAQSRRSQVH